MKPSTSWQLPALAAIEHGGADALGQAEFDFSSNANAAGPLPSVAAAVAAASRRSYPDPDYRALRQHLGAWHGVAAERIVLATSASEFIHRLTLAAARWRGVRRVLTPRPGYGDYAAAARATGLSVAGYERLAELVTTDFADARTLAWITEPASPSGRSGLAEWPAWLGCAGDGGALVALDLAYQPLRFDGRGLPPAVDSAWQLWSPNKACGLTGVRAAYAIAPGGDEAVAASLRALAPGWVVGAEGVALLSSFASPEARAELAVQRALLQAWRLMLVRQLEARGWQVEAEASVTPFFVARPPAPLDHAALRRCGIKLRELDRLGWPGWVRMAAQRPAAVAALGRVLDSGGMA